MRGLYAIVDSHYIKPSELSQQCLSVLESGCKIIQYRDKLSNNSERAQRATELLRLCQRYQAEFIINDELELAATLGCGLHLGSNDADLALARQRLGPAAIIGASCYNQLEKAQQAVAAGASYIAFGAFFNSSTKPEAVSASLDLLTAAKQFQRPIVAIGGITPDNGALLIHAGADMLAVISGLWQADNVTQQSQRYQKLFN